MMILLISLVRAAPGKSNQHQFSPKVSPDQAIRLMNSNRVDDLVLFFYRDATSHLIDQFQYAAELFKINNKSVVFRKVQYNVRCKPIISSFLIEGLPAIVVAKPGPQFKELQGNQKKKFAWQIMQSDGHVTSHKIVEFVNKKTQNQVEHKPKRQQVLWTIALFVGGTLSVLMVLTILKPVFNHYLFWTLLTYVSYIIFTSGIIKLIHDNFTLKDLKSGIPEGLGKMICLGLLAIAITLIVNLHKIVKNRWLQHFLFALLSYFSYWLASQFIGSISIVGMYPPNEYKRGSIYSDQGHSLKSFP